MEDSTHSVHGAGGWRHLGGMGAGVLLAVVFLAVSPSLVLAQQDVDPAPAVRTWLTPVVGFIVVILVLIASFVSSKRGHQD